MDPRRLPMFPLEHALVPYQHLPLHIFEPRYRAMVKDCLAGDREFGVVLIERGREVGGGDQRFSVGTLARVLQAAELPDGRCLLEAVGVVRIAVARWLDDDPYPCAEVTVLADADPTGDLDPWRQDVERLLRQVLALRTELGAPAPSATLSLAGDPAVAAYQATILAGLGPIDVQAVLEASGPEARLHLLTALLDDERDTLSRQITQT